MKKVICLVTALVICISLVCPVLAEEFVPSISYKDTPTIVPVVDDQGNEAIGIVHDADGQIIDYIYGPCLAITPVAQAKTSTLIPDEAEKVLLDVYAKLSDGSMTLPYGEGVDPEKMVIRDLFDVSWLCEEHPVMVAPVGVTVTLTFDLGVSAYTDVVVMTYKNNAWGNIVSVTNNGDGTVTCVFEDFCPVAVAVPTDAATPPAQTGDNSGIMLWVGLMVVSVAALVILVVSKRKVAR